MAIRRLLRQAHMTGGRVMITRDSWIRRQRSIRPGSDGSANAGSVNQSERGSFEKKANRLYQSRANDSAGRPTFQCFGQASDLRAPHHLSLFERYQSSVQKGHRFLDSADETVGLFRKASKLLGQLGVGFFFCWLCWGVCQKPELTLESVQNMIGLLMGNLPEDAQNMIALKIWFVINQLRKNQSDMEDADMEDKNQTDSFNKPAAKTEAKTVKAD